MVLEWTWRNGNSSVKNYWCRVMTRTFLAPEVPDGPYYIQLPNICTSTAYPRKVILILIVKTSGELSILIDK